MSKYVCSDDFVEAKHEVFTEDSMCDKSAFEPMANIVSRMLVAGELSANFRRGIYDFDGDVNLDSARSVPVYSPDFVDITTLNDSIVSDLEKSSKSVSSVSDVSNASSSSVSEVAHESV